MTEIAIDEVVASMGFISLSDMSVPINVGRILVEDYDEVEKHLCIFLVQKYYQQIIDEAKSGINRAGKERALFYAKWYATRRLSSEKEGLSGLVERSKLFMLEDAQNTGWHHALEYEDVAELLASILEGKEGSDEAYDWKFIVEQLMPAAEKADISAKLIMDASLNVKKLRGMVPAARELLQRQSQDTIETEEAQNTLRDWLIKAVDGNVSYSGMKEELDIWRGRSISRQAPLEGYMIMMPEGQFMFCIPTTGNRDVAMIEQALKNRVDIRITGYDWLQQKVIGDSKTYRSFIEEQDHYQELIKEGMEASQEGGMNNGMGA